MTVDQRPNRMHALLPHDTAARCRHACPASTTGNAGFRGYAAGVLINISALRVG